MKTAKEFLKRIDLIKELPEEELNLIINISIYKEYEKGNHVFFQNEPLKYIHFISKGSIKIYKTDTHGKEQIVSILETGDMFPHTGFFSKGFYPAHAEALSDTILIMIPIDEFERLLIENPTLSVKLFKLMGEKIIDLQNRLEEQILHNTYEKIILLLIRLAHKYGDEYTKDKVRLHSRFTHQELANMIGTSRETLNRTITQLKKNDQIDIDNEGYLILHVTKLQQSLIL